MSNEIMAYQHDVFMPVMNIELAISRREQLVKFTKAIMIEGSDYGKIPGTDKPTLLKPGAEKLVVFFGLAPVFVPTLTVQDWTGAEHGGEPLFYYRYKCELYRNGVLMATGEGSCSSRESKYRYRKGERVCPECGKPAIRKDTKGKQGGWYCWAKLDGCGTQFQKGDARIEQQETGRVPNPDVADLDNTILKMAQKRALIAAVLIGVNASEFFTQDMEDFVDSDYRAVDAPVNGEPPKQKPKQQASQEPPKDVDFYPPDGEGNPFDSPAPQPKLGAITEAQRNTLHALGMALYGTKAKWDEMRPGIVLGTTAQRTKSSSDLTQSEAAQLIAIIEKRIRKQYEEDASKLFEVEISVPDIALDTVFGVELATAYGTLRKLLKPEAVAAGK